MFKKIKPAIMAGLGLSAMALFAAPGKANAYSNDYCREYTRTVSIGNRAQEAYGTACLQSDGSWMIVGEGLGNDIPDTATNVQYVVRDNNRYVTPTRVVYYSTPRVNVYRTQPAFVWYQGGHYRKGHHVSYKKYNNDRRWDRHDRRDRHDHRGRDGRGR